MLHTWQAGFLSLAVVSTVLAVTAPQSDSAAAFVPGQVIVKFKAPSGPTAVVSAPSEVAARFNASAARGLLPERLVKQNRHGELDRVFILEFAKDADVRALVKQVAADPAVAYAEPNYICRVMTTPNDSYYSTTGAWGQSFPDMWGLHKIGLGPVGSGSGWDYETGQSNPVVVAVVDTGIDETHPEIVGHLWTNPDEIADNGIDDDNNGYIDDVHGWDFVNNDNSPHDGHGHGTHCSGTIAAATNNGIGVAGISWGATIMPVKGLSDEGSAGTDTLAAAVIYAANNGAKVLSNSWGGVYEYELQTLHDAFRYAAGLGCLSVAAAGNEGNDLFPPFPAKYEEVVAVAASDPSDLKTYFTCLGPNVDITAPGVDILSLRAAGTDMYRDGSHLVGTEYIRANGTSMACPHVSGAAALLWSAHPDWTADQVRQQLQHTADDIERLDPGDVGKLGAGRVNARWALGLTQRPLVRFREVAVVDTGAANPNAAADPGETVSLVVALRNSWLSSASVTATLTTSDPEVSVVGGSAGYGAIAEGEIKDNAGTPFTISVSPTCPLGHVATLDLTTVADGFAWNEQFTLTVAAPQLRPRGYLVLDADGDRDRELDAGETCGLIVRVENRVHAAAARNVTATLSTSDAYLTITQATATCPDIATNTVGMNSDHPFQITMSPDFPADHVAHVQVALSADGFTGTSEMEITLPAATQEISDFVLIPGSYPIDPTTLQVGVDARDRLHVAWNHPDPTLGYLAAHREWDCRQWLPMEQVITSPRVYVGLMSMALDSQGEPHLGVMKAYTIDGFMFPLTSSGAYYRGRDGDWGPTLTISNTFGYLESRAFNTLGISNSDDVHMVWNFERYPEGILVDQTLYHRRRVGGVWQEPTPIVVHSQMQNYYNFKLLPKGNDGMWFMYRFSSSNTILAYRTWDGATWSAEQQVPTGGLYIANYAAAVDSTGRLHVFYQTSMPGSALYYTSCFGGAWSAPVLIPTVPSQQSATGLSLHVDLWGIVHLTWVARTKPATSIIDQVYTRRLSSGQWSDSECVTNFPTTPSRYLYETGLAVDSTGRRHFLFIESQKGVFHLIAPPITQPSLSVRPTVGTLVFQDGRKYPNRSTYAGTLDAHLVEQSPLNNTGGSIALEAGRVDGADAGSDRSAVIRFTNLDTSLEAGKYLTQAVLTLNYFGSRNDPGGLQKTLSVHRLLHDWGEGNQTGLDGAPAGSSEVSWLKPFGAAGSDNPEWLGALTAQFAASSALDSVALGSVEDYGPVSFDVTTAVRKQLLGSSTNFGFVIREEPDAESTENGTRQFDSSESTIPAARPSLTLTFGTGARGDFDLDGDVDLADFGHMQACLSGRLVPQNSLGCQNARMDEDTDVDADDLTIFLRCLQGPDIPSDPSCTQ